MDEGCFSLALPVTPYRSFKRSEVVKNGLRMLYGLDMIFTDIRSLAVWIQTIERDIMSVGPHQQAASSSSSVVSDYTLVDAVSGRNDSNVLMAQWRWCTRNMVASGAKSELVLSGMVQAQFSERHKTLMTSAWLTFDVMGLMQQLQQLVPNIPRDVPIVPNTMQMAMAAVHSDCAAVITHKSPGCVRGSRLS